VAAVVAAAVPVAAAVVVAQVAAVVVGANTIQPTPTTCEVPVVAAVAVVGRALVVAAAGIVLVGDPEIEVRRAPRVCLGLPVGVPAITTKLTGGVGDTGSTMAHSAVTDQEQWVDWEATRTEAGEEVVEQVEQGETAVSVAVGPTEVEPSFLRPKE
jgi:hypothetical protein